VGPGGGGRQAGLNLHSSRVRRLLGAFEQLHWLPFQSVVTRGGWGQTQRMVRQLLWSNLAGVLGHFWQGTLTLPCCCCCCCTCCWRCCCCCYC
jgi:hypothetical protein